MTDELRAELAELREKVEDLEHERLGIKELPMQVAHLTGLVEGLQGVVNSRFDNVDAGVSKASSWDTALKFAGVVVVPVLLALIGGYFALKAGVQTK